MNIIFAASEGVPFIKTGGLGDVIGSLPSSLQEEGNDVRVILPLYSDIPLHFRESMTTIIELTVPVGWRNQYCGLKELTYDGTKFYFIENEYYFKRDGIYGFYDDAERYSFFCRAVLECLPYLNFEPNIIHCNDWHTGMISVFLEAFYKNKPLYKDIHTVFTIHNLAYQGNFSAEILEDILGLRKEYFTTDKLEFDGNVNFMKAGIVFSDLVTTVSNTYSEEIKNSYFGENLDGILREKEYKLYGILNGIDYKKYNPLTDSALFENYSSSKKPQNKQKLQELLGLPINNDVPMLALVSRLVKQKGLDLLLHIFEEILQTDVQIVILGTGEESYERFFLNMAERYPTKVVTKITFDETLAQRIYAGSDIFLMPSLFEPCGLGQLIALRYGSIPVVRETGGLKDTVQSYDENTGTGNGFSFENYNAHDFLFTIKRAINFYHKKDDWSCIVQNALNGDYSWKKSAIQYMDLYRKLNFTS